MLLAEAAAAIGANEYINGDEGLYNDPKGMYGTGVRNLLNVNISKGYSPIILNNEWPILWRLALLLGLTICGTVMNSFYIASFFIDRRLGKTGNVYLAGLGVADMMISSVAIPVATVVLMSKEWETAPVCYSLQFMTQASTYTYSLLSMMIAIETFLRLCKTRTCYARFLTYVPVAYTCGVIFGLSFTASGFGIHYDLDYDYCTRANYGNFTFRLISSVLFYYIPFVCTVTFFGSTAHIVRARTSRLAHFRRSDQYEQDYSFTKVKSCCYLFFVVAWIPYLIIVNIYPDTSDAKYFNCAWLGLIRSTITSIIYGVMNDDFRHAYTQLFCYCCCKTSINVPYNRNRRTAIDYRSTPGEVHLQILHYPTQGFTRDTEITEI